MLLNDLQIHLRVPNVLKFVQPSMLIGISVLPLPAVCPSKPSEKNCCLYGGISSSPVHPVAKPKVSNTSDSLNIFFHSIFFLKINVNINEIRSSETIEILMSE